MSNKNWNEIRDGFVKQSKIALDFIDYCYINNIKLPEYELCSDNEICYSWRLDDVYVGVILFSDGKVRSFSRIAGELERNYGWDKIDYFVYEDLNKYFKENV